MRRVVPRGLRAFASIAALAAASGLMPCARASDDVPFPDALAGADVRIDAFGPGDDLRSRGLVVGNGHMNAIVYVSGKDLMLRVSKNDVWDGRIDTSGDPALPVVDPATHTLKREKPGNPPSWNQPYPCAVPCADVRMGALDGQGTVSGTLSLRRATATLTTSVDTATVRALAQANVFYLQTGRTVELLGVPQKFLPTATSGTSGDISWLRQSIPGDEDVKGMEVCLATGANGTCRAIAVVTSLDDPRPLERAGQLVRETLAAPEEKLLKDHDTAWADFWGKSGLRLSEKQFQNWWYRMVYYFGCFSRKGATAVGLKASFDGLAGWHNSYKFNYNIQQTYISAGPINHPELAEPLIDVVANYWPRARWFARTCFVGCEGGFVHSDVFHPHEPDPATCTSKNRHQLAYIPWGYTLGMQGHIAVILWEYYQYKPDPEYLRTKTYPILRDIALFYCSFLEKCRKDDQGRILVGPSYFPENFYFGQDNGAYDLPYVSYGLKAAREAARVLKTDEDLIRRIETVLAQMPYYEQVPDPVQDGKPVVTYYRGVREFPKDDRHASMVQAVFPAGQVTSFSPREEQDLFRRTINLVGRITTHANSPVTLNTARARLGMVEEAWSSIAIDFTQHHKEQPNGLFAWKAHGSYISEQVGVSRLITELLLQSVGDVIRIFPAWPEAKDAEFARLRAQGGFLVSARMKAGVLSDLRIESTAGGDLRIVNPWPGSTLLARDARTGTEIAARESGGIVAVPTLPGMALSFSRSR